MACELSEFVSRTVSFLVFLGVMAARSFNEGCFSSRLSNTEELQLCSRYVSSDMYGGLE